MLSVVVLIYCLCVHVHLTHRHTQSILMAIFPGEPGLAGCPLNSPSPFILELCILLGQAQTFHVIFNTIPPGLVRTSSLSNSFNFPLYTTFDPVIIIFSFKMSIPSQPTLLERISVTKQG